MSEIHSFRVKKPVGFHQLINLVCGKNYDHNIITFFTYVSLLSSLQR